MDKVYIYALVILILIGADMLSKGNPWRMLFLFSSLGALALIIGMSTNGILSVYAFNSVGLFCSTLLPCIFTLAISGLGKNTSQGSSFLIMMIMGGGIVSWFQGYVADHSNIQASYWVGVVCFLYLAFYAIAVKGIGAGCDEEAVRIIMNSRPWSPAKQRGKPVKQRMVLPITFKLASV